MRREQEDPDLGVLGSDRARGVEALGGLRRRHADVHHDEVGLVLADQVFQFGAVGGLGDDRVAGTGKDPGDALAQEDIVIRYDHPPAGHFGGIM